MFDVFCEQINIRTKFSVFLSSNIIVMRRIFLLISLFAVLLSCTQMAPAASGDNSSTDQPNVPSQPSGPEDEGYDIFLLIGQSNMAGRGPMIEGDREVYSDKVFLLDKSGKAVPATNPLNQYSTVGKSVSLQQIGPGFSFSKKLAQETGRKILLVVNARAETAISEWLPDASTGYFNAAVLRTKQALTLGGELKAVLWHQGCHDSYKQSDIDVYLSRLRTIVVEFRKQTQTASVFIAGELPQWRPYSAAFNKMLKDIYFNVPYADYVSSEGCTCVSPANDDPHFSRDGQLILGERYADKVLEICYPDL